MVRMGWPKPVAFTQLAGFAPTPHRHLRPAGRSDHLYDFTIATALIKSSTEEVDISRHREYWSIGAPCRVSWTADT